MKMFIHPKRSQIVISASSTLEKQVNSLDYNMHVYCRFDVSIVSTNIGQFPVTAVRNILKALVNSFILPKLNRKFILL